MNYHPAGRVVRLPKALSPDLPNGRDAERAFYPRQKIPISGKGMHMHLVNFGKFVFYCR